MVWGLKTSVNTGVSAHVSNKTASRVMTATGLGILFVFMAPGQITSANFTSAMSVANHPETPSEIPPLLRQNIQLAATDIKTEKPVIEPSVETKIGETSSVVQSVTIAAENPEPVQLASLDLDIPDITKPKVFVPNKRIQPQSLPPALRTTPKLKKKLFGSVELKFDDERKIKAWSSVYERFLSDVNGLKACIGIGCADPLLANWADELRPLQNLSTYQKIEAVNVLVNRRAYADDRRNYGRSDYWASPSEFLTRGGDCEDYAILKFASLLALGVRDDDMRLVVGRLSNGTPHAFLATNIGSEEYILDNRFSQVYLTTNRKDYVPKYSMNLSHRWSHVMPGATTT